MSVEYHRGDWASPKGHAFIYLRNSLDHEEVWATYVVVLPITVDLSKYVPPFLMNQIGEMDAKDLSAFAFPPVPERVSGYDALESMAEVRDDDILYVGTHNPSDVTGALGRVSEAVQSYSEQYAQVAGSSTVGGETQGDDPDAETEELSVSDVLYGLMSDSDKLSELSKLIGRLRFAVDGSDEQTHIGDRDRDRDGRQPPFPITQHFAAYRGREVQRQPLRRARRRIPPAKLPPRTRGLRQAHRHRRPNQRA